MNISGPSESIQERVRLASDQLRATASQFMKELSSQIGGLVAEHRTQSTSVAGDDALVAEEAWRQLREHPHLLWVPPVWRAHHGATEAFAVMRRRAISAIDRNLVIELGHYDDGAPWVRLATGQLQDRPTSEGLDPLNAGGSVDPKLDVKAPSFSAAVVELRDALFRNYGDGAEPTPSASLSTIRR